MLPSSKCSCQNKNRKMYRKMITENPSTKSDPRVTLTCNRIISIRFKKEPNLKKSQEHREQLKLKKNNTRN